MEKGGRITVQKLEESVRYCSSIKNYEYLGITEEQGRIITDYLQASINSGYEHVELLHGDGMSYALNAENQDWLNKHINPQRRKRGLPSYNSADLDNRWSHRR